MIKTELLVPVGNKECLISAIENGADAVYLGGKKFGARAYSNNFNEDELLLAIKYCHLYGVKIYVTVNTIIFNEEVKEVIYYLNFLYTNNVDAVIMQDIGLINLTRKLLPNLDIHVSTQAHNHNQEGIDYFKNLGCTRIVFDRESSLNEIKNIKNDIEKEVFIYGALCICYSGNCLFSALNGGRSANRGMCVGSCRLPYTLNINNQDIKTGYLLSTKDLNTTTKIKEILDAKITSLKIEGRMKSKEYVALVTKTYRRLIDSYYDKNFKPITKDELKNLAKVYNREFTTGYLFDETNIINSKTSNHQGIKIGKIVGGNNKRIIIKLIEDLHQEDAIRIANTDIGMYLNTLYDKNGLLVSHVKSGSICEIDNKERILVKDYLNHDILKTIDYSLNKEIMNFSPRRIPITMIFNSYIGQKAILKIYDGQNNIEINGPLIEEAKTAGVSIEKIKEQLSKLGNTPYKQTNIEVNTDSNIFINLKDINEMRRAGVERLTAIREGFPKSKTYPEIKTCISKKTTPHLSILTRTKEQLIVALNNHIDTIYVTEPSLYEQYKKNNNIYLRLERVQNQVHLYHNERLLCTELGSINTNKDNNHIISDYYLNVTNDYTIASLRELKVKRTTLSIELTIKQLQDIKNKEDSEIIIYGYPELMIIKNNIFNLTNETAYLINTKKEKYRLITNNDYTHIMHNEPINLINNLKELKGFHSYRIELFNEDIKATQSIINNVKNML